MAWVAGDMLTTAQRDAVRNSFGYRWTVENERRARQWYGGSRPTVPLVSDDDWLASHAFYVTNLGELSRRHRHCTSAALGALINSEK